MTTYLICVREALSSSWQGYFGTLTLNRVERGGKTITELEGQLDEAGLFTTLQQLYNLNLHLLSVNTTDDGVTRAP